MARDGFVGWVADTPRRDGGPQVSASSVLDDGRFDAWAVMGLRCVRTLSVLLVMVGLTIALESRAAETISDQLSTPAGVLSSIETPLAVLVTGVLVRAVVTPLAWFAALSFVVRTSTTLAPRVPRQSLMGRWFDQFRLVGAVRMLRWTTPVRDLAMQTLGRTGERLRYLDIALKTATVIATVVLLVRSLG